MEDPQGGENHTYAFGGIRGGGAIKRGEFCPLAPSAVLSPRRQCSSRSHYVHILMSSRKQLVIQMRWKVRLVLWATCLTGRLSTGFVPLRSLYPRSGKWFDYPSSPPGVFDGSDAGLHRSLPREYKHVDINRRIGSAKFDEAITEQLDGDVVTTKFKRLQVKSVGPFSYTHSLLVMTSTEIWRVPTVGKIVALPHQNWIRLRRL